MKSKNIVSIGIAALLLVGCIEENFEHISPANDGDVITFGARAGFENGSPNTKTVYSGDTYAVTIGEQTTVFERIDWDDDADQIEIYSNQAANGPRAYYLIKDASKTDNVDDDTASSGDDSQDKVDHFDEAYLIPIGESSLQWNGNENHTFYAMYPSSTLFSDDVTLSQGITIDDAAKMNGIIPVYQHPTMTSYTDESNVVHYVAEPDMRYAYMAAKTVANRKNGQVRLDFVPVVTAIQLHFVLPSGAGVQDLDIAEVRLQGEGIAGNFTADLSEKGWPSSSTYPTYTRVDGGTNRIQITTRINDQPIRIKPGGSLTLTAFLRPGADITGLRVYVSPEGSNEVGLTLTNVTIKDNCKNNIKNLLLPRTVTYSDSDWLNQIPENTEMKALSLPGTGGSFTFAANDTNFKQQTLDFNAQWAAGIRAFEISSDRPTNSSYSLGRNYVTCNKEDITSWPVINVFNTIIDKVTVTKETAVIILTYQPEGNSPARNATEYANSLNVMLTGNDGNYSLTQARRGKIIEYTPGLTYGQAKGKIIVLCRINQKGENDGGSFEDASSILKGTNVTLIDGCGTAKDRWGARGYKVDYKLRSWTREWSNGFLGLGAGWGNKNYGSYSDKLEHDFALDLSNSIEIISSTIEKDTQSGYDKDGGYAEYYMNDRTSATFTSYPKDLQLSSEKNGYKLYRPRKDNPEDLNFGFTTNVSKDGVTTICWFQEWARVIETPIQAQGIWSDGLNNGSYNIFWFESYNEKLSNAITSFEMAINGTRSNYVYINSLCGYLGTAQTNTSARGYSLAPSLNNIWGGAGGDIAGLANKINPDFCQYVLNSGMSAKSGPTGIILIDFVTNQRNAELEYDGSYLLPGAIISNNFKY